ncbi:MAG TPA: ATP-binding cassette domain-containing protein, partial [Steroidobacteraceae bacterium]|nr:ATP-binding cassette domain-containing protein [Steroidobacteraceae bacterium]
DLPPNLALSSELAVDRLLHRLGVADRLPRASVDEEHWSSDAVLRMLARYGVHGRLARIGKSNLRQVELPTLLSLKDANWLLLVAMRSRKFIVEDALGVRHSLSREAITEAFDGLALDRNPPLPPGATIWRRIARLAWAHRRSLYPAILLGLLAQGLNLLVPQLARLLVDRAFPSASLHLLGVIIMGMILVALFQSWGSWLAQRITQCFHIRLDATLERALFEHLMCLRFEYLEKKSIGQLMQGVQGVGKSRAAVTGDALTAMFGGVTASALLVLMWQLMAGPTLVVAGIGIAATTIAIGIGQRQDKLQRRVVNALIRERECAAEILTRIAILKASGAERRNVERWQGLLKVARLAGLQGERLGLGSELAVGLLGQLQLQGLWVWGGLRVIEGTLQLGELLAFTLMASAFHAAVAKLGTFIVTLRTAAPHLREAESLLSQRRLPIVRRASEPQRPVPIHIRDLWFRYGEGRPWVLKGFGLDVAPGEFRFISGPSGSGKTTLLKLVASLYEPSKGDIRIAGRTPDQMRDLVMYLPQFVRPFNASVLDNLRLFSGGVPIAQLLQAAQLTGLAKWIDTLPMGYDTLLAHGGSNFSGGQRQLIALTAALASQRPLLLLDEASANLDALRWSELRRNPLFAGKTILCASHQAIWRRTMLTEGLRRVVSSRCQGGN